MNDSEKIDQQTVAAVLVCIGAVASLGLIVWASVHTLMGLEWPTWAG